MMFSNKRGVRLPSPDKGQGAARDYPEPGSLFPQYSDPVPDDEYNNEGEFVVDHINDEEFIDFTNVMSDGKLMAGSAAATTTPQFKMFSTKKTPTTDKTIPLHAQTDETMSDDGTRYTHPSEFPCMSPPRPKYIYSHDPNNQNNETAITEEDKLTKVWIKYRLCILLAILVALVLMIIVLPISVSKGKANSKCSSSLNKASPTIAPSVYTGNAYEANIDMFPPSIIQAQPTASVPIGTPSAAPVRLSKPTNKPSDMGPTTFPTSFTMEPTSGQPTPLPTTQPPTVPRQHPLVGVLYQVTPADKLLNPFTPQGEALSWLVAADKQVPNFRAPERIVQRYAMTVLDVALHAPNPRLWSARYLHECKWAGVTCNDQKHVTEINWARQELQGTIPAELGLLSHLEKLDVAQNNLKGTLDPLYSLTKLKHAYLFENYLTGTLSEKLENCRNMTRLFIGHNDLTGTIPALDLRPLEWFMLHYNRFTGTLPSTMALTMMTVFDVSWNSLTGTIPDNLATSVIPNIRHLHLDHNRFTGTIPQSFVDLGKGRLRQLYLNDNNLSGKFPVNWLTVKFLNNIDLSRNDFKNNLDEMCKMAVFEFGELVELRADCGICNCQRLCRTCKDEKDYQYEYDDLWQFDDDDEYDDDAEDDDAKP